MKRCASPTNLFPPTYTTSHVTRILLAPGVFPPDSGGPATFATDIGTTLVDRGHKVRVVTNGEAPPGFDDRYPFEVVRIPRRSNVVTRYAGQFWTLFREIRTFDPDVVLSNAFDLQAVFTARLLQVPVATKVVGDNAWEQSRRAGLDDGIDEFQETRYGAKVTLLKILRTAQTRAAHRVLVPSKYLKSVVTQWGVAPEDVGVIYNSLDLDVPDVPLADRARRIVTVGRLVNWKGIEGLIQAFDRLATDDPDVELHIVGDGPQRDALEATAAGTTDPERIVFHGRVPHNDVLELMSHSRIFALNSMYEGLPHVALEAMSCGTPMVLSHAGGSPEVVDDGISGFVVDQNDVDTIVDRFRTLLNDDDTWRATQTAAYNRLDDRFDSTEMVDEYVEELERLASL